MLRAELLSPIDIYANMLTKVVCKLYANTVIDPPLIYSRTSSVPMDSVFVENIDVMETIIAEMVQMRQNAMVLVPR